MLANGWITENVREWRTDVAARIINALGLDQVMLEGKRQFSFPDIRGWQVLNTTGHPIGRVEEVFVDPNTLEPAMALLHYKKFLNFNTKMLLAPWNELRLGPDFVMTRWSEDQLRPETAARVPSASPAHEVASSVEITMRPHPAAVNR